MELYVDHGGLDVRSPVGSKSSAGRCMAEPLCLVPPIACGLGTDAEPTFAGSDRFCMGRQGAAVVVIAKIGKDGTTLCNETEGP